MTVFMERLQILMDENNLNDTTLREMCGFSKNAITNWRNGMRPQPATVHRLADFFGVSYDWLRGVEDFKDDVRRTLEPKQEPPEPLLQELMQMYKECDPQSQIYINNVIWSEWNRCKRNRNETTLD